MKPLYILILVCMIGILVISLPVEATNNVSVNASSSSASYDTSATWSQLSGANLSVSTGTGITYILVSMDARVNYTGAKLYARIKRDSSVIVQYNISQNTYAQTYSFVASSSETTGTHKYGLEVYSTAGRKATIYSWNMSVMYLSTGSYGSGTGGGGGAGNVSSVTGAPAGVLDCTGTEDVTCTITAPASWTTTQNTTYDGYGDSITAAQNNDTYFNGTVFPNSTNFRNDSVSAHTSQISALQGNDTTDRSFVNNTFLPITTYAGNFPNTTIAGYNGNFPNSSLANYLLVSAYGSNFPNTSLPDYLLISTYSGNFPNSTLAGYGSNFPNTSLANYLLISAYSGNFPNSTLSGYGGNFPNSTVAGYTGNFPNSTVAGNLAAWNATYNATYDAKVGWTQTLFDTAFHTEIPVCTGNDKLTSANGDTVVCATDQTGSAGGNVSSVAATLPLTTTGTTDIVIADPRTDYPNSTVAGNLANWNSTYNASYLTSSYNATYDAKPSSTFNSTYDGTTTTVNNNLAVWNATYNSTYAGYGTSITGLQSNDSSDRSFVNTTFLPIATYSGNFPNTSLINYLLISTYGSNFPNSTVAGNLAAWNATYNATYDAKPTTTYVNDADNLRLLISTYTGNFPNSSLANYLLTATYSGNFPNSSILSLQTNDSNDRAFVNDTFLPITTYSGNFPNSTVASNLANWNATYNSSYENRSITIIISNGSSAIATGIKGDVTIPFNGTILESTGMADQSGSCNVSFWKDTYANYPPTAADVVGYVNISSATKVQNTGLSYAVTRGDILRFNVDSCTTITRETVSLTVRTGT